MIQTLLANAAARAVERCVHGIEVHVSPGPFIDGVRVGAAGLRKVVSGDLVHVPIAGKRNRPLALQSRQGTTAVEAFPQQMRDQERRKAAATPVNAKEGSMVV